MTENGSQIINILLNLQIVTIKHLLMKTFLHILIGFVIGVIFTLGVLYIYAVMHQEDIEAVETPSYTYNVKTNDGTVTLYTGMSRDSVCLILGEPDSFETHNIQGHIIEMSGFKTSNNSIPDLIITFEDGLLKDVSQQGFLR